MLMLLVPLIALTVGDGSAAGPNRTPSSCVETTHEDRAGTPITDADEGVVIPGPSSGGNAAVEARWAAAWSAPRA